jgi:DnaJ-class molecular chaperone
MLCGNCRGDGHIIIRIQKADGSIEYVPEDCPECLGVGEIQTESTPMYPDSKGCDDYD